MKYLDTQTPKITVKIPYEVIDASEFPMDRPSDRLPKGSLVDMIDSLFNLPSSQCIRFIANGSLIHIAQHLRNAATRKGKKISIAARGNYIYLGKG